MFEKKRAHAINYHFNTHSHYKVSQTMGNKMFYELYFLVILLTLLWY